MPSNPKDANTANKQSAPAEATQPDVESRAGPPDEVNQGPPRPPDLTRPPSDPSRGSPSRGRPAVRWLAGLGGAALVVVILIVGIRLGANGGATAPIAPSTSSATATPQWIYYTVRSGETLADVAQQTHVGLKELLAWNRLDASAALHEGQRLIIGVSNVPTKEPVATPQRLDLTAAGQKIRGWYQAVLAERNDGTDLPLEELTTAEIWNRLELQVFQVSAGNHRYDAFLIRNGQVQQMALASGGRGLTSLAVVDLNADGQPELLYTFSQGAQPHRSFLALYSPAFPEQGMLIAEEGLSNGELRLKKTDDQHVEVEAEVNGQGYVALGRAILAPQAGRPQLSIPLQNGLPDSLLSQLSTQPFFRPTGLAAGQGTLAMTANVNGVSQVFVLQSDGSHLRMISDGSHAATWPSLAPDGRRIAFAVNYDDNGYDFDIVVVDLITGTAQRLTNDTFVEQHPVWSPDESHIAFESDRESAAPGVMDIFVMNADGSNVRRVLANAGSRSLNGWSANGEEVYATSHPSETGQNQPIGALTAVNVTNGQTREICNLPERVRGDTQAAVSPDGRRIAYVNDTETGSAIMLVEGGVERQLSAGQGDASLPVWSPDGKWLAYSNLVASITTPVYVQVAGGSEMIRNPDFQGQITSWVAANDFPPG